MKFKNIYSSVILLNELSCKLELNASYFPKLTSTQYKLITRSPPKIDLQIIPIYKIMIREEQFVFKKKKKKKKEENVDLSQKD